MNGLFEWLWSNPTRATGVVAYSVALACCVFAWKRANGDAAKSRLAAFLAACEGSLLLDIVFNVRWNLHQLFMDKATLLAVYASRRVPQEIALVVLVGVFLISFRVATKRLGGRVGAVFAVSGVLLSLGLWCTEVVSLHAVDHILYHSTRKVMPVSFLWVLACTMTSIGVLVESKKARKVAPAYLD